MPNHVTNRIRVFGDEAEILRMLEEIRQDAQAILNVNNRYDDPELERLAERIRSAAEALQKE